MLMHHTYGDLYGVMLLCFTLYIQATYSDMYWVCGKGEFYLYKKVQEDKRKVHKGYKWLFKCGCVDNGNAPKANVQFITKI